MFGIFAADPIMATFSDLYNKILGYSAIMVVVNLIIFMCYTWWVWTKDKKPFGELVWSWGQRYALVFLMVIWPFVFFSTVKICNIVALDIRQLELPNYISSKVNIENIYEQGQKLVYSHVEKLDKENKIVYNECASAIDNNILGTLGLKKVVVFVAGLVKGLMGFIQTALLAIIFVGFPIELAKAMLPHKDFKSTIWNDFTRLFRVASWSIWFAVIDQIYALLVGSDILTTISGGEISSTTNYICAQLAYIVLLTQVSNIAARFDVENIGNAVQSIAQSAGIMASALPGKTAGKVDEAGAQINADKFKASKGKEGYGDSKSIIGRMVQNQSHYGYVAGKKIKDKLFGGGASGAVDVKPNDGGGK